jgi:hypothetical protein
MTYQCFSVIADVRGICGLRQQCGALLTTVLSDSRTAAFRIRELTLPTLTGPSDSRNVDGSFHK